VESVPEAVKAEDYGFDSEVKKKKDQKKFRLNRKLNRKMKLN